MFGKSNAQQSDRKSMRMLLLSVALTLPFLAGCGQIRAHKGFIVDQVLVDSVQAGVDNKTSVERTLGRPTFTGQFNENDWYYVSRDTRQLAFGEPTPTDQLVLRIQFDAAGNVSSVERAGLEKVVSINPDGKKTATLGRDRGFFEDLFGNIGAVGAPGAGAPAGGPGGP